jgi:CRISPR type III-A-associated protein Csm2
MSEERVEGTVKMYNAEKGFGFITWRAGEDIYVHRSVVERANLETLTPGDRVSFVVQTRDGKTRADRLLRIGAGSQPPAARTASAPAVAPGRPNSQTDFRFGEGYLPAGYFEQKGDKHYLRPEVLDSAAIDVAKALGNAGMKSAQLRRFFSKARGIEAKLDRDRDKDFQQIIADIYGFKRDVAYQVGRKIVPEQFREFINRNVDLAVTDQESFKQGFLQHFESVVAYFVYYFRD